MKKLLLPLLGALIALPTLARDFTYTYEGQTINYTVIDEEAKTCKTREPYLDPGCNFHKGNHVEGDLILPSNPRDGETEFTLIVIGKDSFFDNSGLTSVTIPNSVNEIGSGAFVECSRLTSVTIGNSVTSIGYKAFSSCSSLTSIIIPNSITQIGDHAFDNCANITSIEIPNSVTSIGDHAFVRCTGLSKVEFSSIEHMCSIEFGGFYANPLQCAHALYINGELVTSVVIPESITSIGNWAFAGASCLSSIILPGGITKICKGTFYGCSGLTSITIPNSVTVFGAAAFSECSGLKSITIPNSVTEIGEGAFDKCTRLASVVIPNSVTKIHMDAFLGCSSLTSITYLAEEPVASDSDIFDDETYQKATLNYLKSAEEKIAVTSPWSRFVNRIGRDADYKAEGAISEVQTTDGSANTIYDMRGIKVGNSTDSLPKGIYIIREGSTTRKIAI